MVNVTTNMLLSDTTVDFSEAFTLAFWVYFPDQPNSVLTVIGKEGSITNTTWRFRIQTDSGNTKLRFDSELTTSPIDCGIVSTNYVHFTLTYDGTAIYTLYRDGVSIQRINTNTKLTGRLRLGLSNTTATFQYGSIDEIRVYDFGLNHNQVNKLLYTNDNDFKNTDITQQTAMVLPERDIDLNFGGYIRKYTHESNLIDVIAEGYMYDFVSKDYGITYYGKGVFEILQETLNDVFPSFEYHKDSDITDLIATSLTIDGKYISFLKRIIKLFPVILMVDFRRRFIVRKRGLVRSSIFTHGSNCVIYTKEEDDSGVINEAQQVKQDINYNTTATTTTITNSDVASYAYNWHATIVAHYVPLASQRYKLTSGWYTIPSDYNQIKIIANATVVFGPTANLSNGSGTQVNFSDTISVGSHDAVANIPVGITEYIESSPQNMDFTFRTLFNTVKIERSGSTFRIIMILGNNGSEFTSTPAAQLTYKSANVTVQFGNQVAHVSTSGIDVDIGRREITTIDNGGKSILIPDSSKDHKWQNDEIIDYLQTQTQKTGYKIIIPSIFVGLGLGDNFRAINTNLGLNSNVNVAAVKIKYPGQTTIITDTDEFDMYDAFSAQKSGIDDATAYTGSGKISVSYNNLTTNAQKLAFLRKIGYVD